MAEIQNYDGAKWESEQILSNQKEIEITQNDPTQTIAKKGAFKMPIIK